jgi:hypothetical protein
VIEAVRLNFERDGALHAAGVLDAEDIDGLRDQLADLAVEKAGARLFGRAELATPLSSRGKIGRIAADILGAGTRPVRAVLFDKTATTNWGVAWHQDRVIVVKRRADVEGFGPWSVKDGLQHAAPPFPVLEAMVTLRVHLDDVGEDNAPLLIAPGSHRLGRIAVSDIPEAVSRCGVRTCLAMAGDIWAYATPIVHASRPANQPRRRRVLQVDYAARELPGDLEWLGV